MQMHQGDAVPRTTITLSDERYRALKKVAASRGLTMTEIVDQALELAGVNTARSVREMLAEAGRRAGLSDQEAMALALRETASERAEHVVAERSEHAAAESGGPSSPAPD